MSTSTSRKETRTSDISTVHDDSDGIAGICSKDTASTAPTDCLAAILEKLDPPPPDDPAPIYLSVFASDHALTASRIAS